MTNQQYVGSTLWALSNKTLLIKHNKDKRTNSSSKMTKEIHMCNSGINENDRK